ncbi:MAG: hypothetical protein HW421_1446 [Ignavibacteria bacterium]|nr:hypothetical protein [Ignavibacteria bacterium]
MKDNDFLANQWITRAISNLEKAKCVPASDKILFEDLCFDCQQAVEKALKALLIYNEIEFPKTHSLNQLIFLLHGKIDYIPEFVNDSVYLTDYSVSTRYPGDYEPVTKKEFQEALEISQKVVDWVSSSINKELLF